MTPEIHDSVLLFSKTWVAVYLGVFFIVAVVWTFWPSHKKDLNDAAQVPLEEEDKPWK